MTNEYTLDAILSKALCVSAVLSLVIERTVQETDTCDSLGAAQFLLDDVIAGIQSLNDAAASGNAPVPVDKAA